MNKDTAEKWFAKGDNDYKTAVDELRTAEPTTDTVCFHAQQCIEKYLKGFLVFHGIVIDKTHNLSLILNKCITFDHSFQELQNKNVDSLTPYATTFRYPDDFYMPTIEEAQEAVEKVLLVIKFVKRMIELTS